MLNSRKNVGVASLVFGLALGVVGSVGSSSATADRPTTHTKVTICHATGSESKPYVKISVSRTAVNGSTRDGRGDHLNHAGPVWFPGAKAAGVKWGDIIPPMTGVTRGLNWPAGQSIFDNDCEFIATPTVKSATTTVKATTTTAVSVKGTPTTAPKQTTTTGVSGAQTTTTAVLSSGGTVPGSNEIPKTGRESSGMLLLGGVFVVLGTVLLGLTRRSAIR